MLTHRDKSPSEHDDDNVLLFQLATTDVRDVLASARSNERHAAVDKTSLRALIQRLRRETALA